MPASKYHGARNIIRLKDNQRRQRQRHDHDTWATQYMFKVAACIGCICGLDFAPAVLWLRSDRRRGCAINPDVSDEVLKAKIEDFLLNARDEDVANWLNEDAHRRYSPCKVAADWVKQLRASMFVQNGNVVAGMPVPSSEIIKQYLAMTGEEELDMHEGPATICTGPYKKKWLRNFRQRFQLRYGKGRLEPNTTPEELLTKARSSIYKCIRQYSLYGVPLSRVHMHPPRSWFHCFLHFT